MTARPALSPALSPEDFWNWYWTREELSAFCQDEGLRQDGNKAALFARVHAALDGRDDPTPKRKRGKGATNWARDALALETVIDEGVSFGPNFRGFMSSQVGKAFSCHSDFMAWVRSHPGSTLADAVAAWRMLEARKEDPDFRREIAADNQYLQYVRDYLDAFPHDRAEAARAAWLKRRGMPAPGGRIVFDRRDRTLLE